MITSNERQSVGNGYLSVGEFYGLSTDTKPTNTANGSTFFEMDTGKMYRYNFAAHTWTQTTHYGNTGGFGPAPSGGGSGGGVEVVNITFVCSYGEYDVTTNIPVVVDGSTFVGQVFTVGKASGPVTIGIPKFGAGPIRTQFGDTQVIYFDNLGGEPQVSGDATLDLNTHDMVINGDCTFTAAGRD